MPDVPTPRKQDDLYGFKDDQPIAPGPSAPPPMVEPVEPTLAPWQHRPRRGYEGGISWRRVAVGIVLLAAIAALGLYIRWRYQKDSRELQAGPPPGGPPANQPLYLGKMDPLAAGLIRGQDFLEHGKFQRALEVYQETRRKQGKDVPALRVGEARALLGLGRLDDAARLVEAALAAEAANDASVYAARADILLAGGAFQAALDDCDKAASLGDSGPEATMRRARCLAALGRSAEADDLLARAAAGRTDDPLFRVERGEVLGLYLHRLPDALTDLNSALMRSESMTMPHRARARLVRGLVFLLMGNPAEAVIDLEAAVATRDTDARALSACADALAQTGQAEKAVQVLTRLLEQTPDDRRAALRLCEAMICAARPADALARLAKLTPLPARRDSGADYRLIQAWLGATAQALAGRDPSAAQAGVDRLLSAGADTAGWQLEPIRQFLTQAEQTDPPMPGLAHARALLEKLKSAPSGPATQPGG